MTTKNTGGPAFPTRHENYERDYSCAGLTLRDYFAAKALNGYLSDSNCRRTFTDLAADCYLMADAMLAERDKP